MKKLSFFLRYFFVLIFAVGVSTSVLSQGQLIFGDNTLENRDMRLDINSASKEQMLKAGIAISYVNKIEEYKKITGGFKELSHMKRISGIGDATYARLQKKFKLETPAVTKRFDINRADEMKLKYFGFTKDEIKQINKHKAEKKGIQGNIHLMEILSKSRYREYRDLVDY